MVVCTYLRYLIFRSLLNCVNSIPQMNSSVCEHKNLIKPSSDRDTPQPTHPPPDDGLTITLAPAYKVNRKGGGSTSDCPQT